ncbi:transmembrane protease serine 3 [Chanos chanos]|uniref:Transmembrane protease serine 3 n=1 Tax=Chanos chanos TaxID=29144 RepID=A0A6J2WGL2_CHACN|nr:transmembrane protease serine 3 [Chanos chanos]
MAIPEESGAKAGVDTGSSAEGTGEGAVEANGGQSTFTNAQDGTAEQPDPTRIEVVSVTDEELPAVDTPTTLNVSPIGSQNASPVQENGTSDPASDTAQTRDPPADSASTMPAPPSPVIPVTKVQPFLSDDVPEEKTLRGRLFARRMELLIGACVLLILSLALGVGLGVGLSCAGKFRCGFSSQCVGRSAQCDGQVDCDHGEDELNCVRLSGKNSVLQVCSGGDWKTVCSEDWNPVLALLACKQLGYSRYVESKSLPISSIEQDLQHNLVSINLSQYNVQQIVKIHNVSSHSKTQCSTGMVTTLKCLDCGSRPQFSSRIVGGNLSVEGQFPWQASLHFQSEHLCGGSVVASRWILTAAHCVYGFAYPQLWAVHVGLTQQPVNGAQSLAVEKIFYHARYRPKGLDYDIALMKLVEPLNFNGYVEPICLPNFGEEFEDGKICWISGWGATEDGGEASVSLHSARVPLISTKACSQPEVYQGFISPWMICAGYLEGGTDSCQGDSGGPLACEDSGVWKLVGATSWGQGCAERNKPGVYTRITESLTWIRQQMEREETLNPSAVSSDS